MRTVNSPFSNDAVISDLPFPLNGTFDWLARTPKHDEWAIGERSLAKLPTQLSSIKQSANRNHTSLPIVFTQFISNPELHEHVRSCTACYLDVANEVLPFADGFLIRFLADQQGCAFWYLYINRAATDHCVVMSFEYFDAEDIDYDPEDISESDFQVMAESFEAFVFRFWLENEIWYAKNEGSPFPNVDQRFLELYAQ